MNNRKFCRVWWLVHGVLLAGVLLFLAAALIWERLFPAASCVFLRVAHLYCPGCGGTRAVRALVQGRLLQAFLCYPPIAVLLGVVAWGEVCAILAYKRKSTAPLSALRSGKWLLLVAGAILLWFILHNALYLAFGYDFLGDLTKV